MHTNTCIHAYTNLHGGHVAVHEQQAQPVLPIKLANSIGYNEPDYHQCFAAQCSIQRGNGHGVMELND